MQCRNDGRSALVDKGCNGRGARISQVQHQVMIEAKDSTSGIIFARERENIVCQSQHQEDNRPQMRVVEFLKRSRGQQPTAGTRQARQDPRPALRKPKRGAAHGAGTEIQYCPTTPSIGSRLGAGSSSRRLHQLADHIGDVSVGDPDHIYPLVHYLHRVEHVAILLLHGTVP